MPHPTPPPGTDPAVLDHRRPVLRARAPLRISFAGGGTDVSPFPEREGGAVLSSTISSFSFSTLRPRNDGKVTVSSLDYGTSVDFHIDADVEFDGQLDLPKAAIARIRDLPGAVPSGGFDLFLHTQAPPGSGWAAPAPSWSRSSAWSPSTAGST